MKLRRALIFILVLVMIFTVAGCKAEDGEDAPKDEVKVDTEKTEEPETDETVTEEEPETLENIDISMSLWGISDYIVEGESDAMLDYIQDKFSITILPINVGWGDADEKYNVWAASNQLPDIIGAIATVGNSRYFQWTGDGVVRALPEDLSKYPTLDNILSMDDVTAFNIDGKQYFIPRQVYQDASYWCMDRAILVRKDWLDALGLEITVGMDEESFKDAINAMVYADFDGNGIDDTIGIATGEITIMSQFFSGHGYTEPEMGDWIKGADGNWVPVASTESALNGASFLRQLFKDGLLDTDFATTNKDEGTEKFVTGKAAVFLNQGSPKHLNTIYKNWIQANETPFWESVAIVNPPLAGDGYTYIGLSSFWSETYFSSSVDDEKMDRILMLYDYLYSQEGLLFSMYGFEGQDYEMVDGQVNLLMGEREDGSLKVAADIYKSANVFNMLAAWNADLLQYVDPSIPTEVRNMAVEARDYRLSEWMRPPVDFEIKAMNIEERNDMTVDFISSWTQFIMNTSDAADEDLYAEMMDEWNANGMEEAIVAVTEAAAKVGK